MMRALSDMMCEYRYLFFFFQAEDGIRDVAVTGVQTCALPISLSTGLPRVVVHSLRLHEPSRTLRAGTHGRGAWRSEEHTSELQSRLHLVCRLLLEKKKKLLVALDILHGAC